MARKINLLTAAALLAVLSGPVFAATLHTFSNASTPAASTSGPVFGRTAPTSPPEVAPDASMQATERLNNAFDLQSPASDAGAFHYHGGPKSND
jgi:hypothetical protein